MKRNLLTYSLVVLALLSTNWLSGQTLPLFEHYGSEDGLSNREARPIAQDDRGFIWIGTVDGLNRFDGIEFKSYFKDTTEFSLASNRINSLYWGSDKLLWIATEEGLCCLNPKTDVVSRCPRNVGEHGELLRAEHVIEDRNGEIWVVYDNLYPSRGGLARYDKSSGTYQNFMDDENIGGVHVIQDDVDDDLFWVGAYESVCRVNVITNEVTRKTCPDCRNVNFGYQWIEPLNDDELLITAFYDGVYKYHKTNDTWNKISDKEKGLSFLRETETEFWFCTQDSALGLLDIESGDIDFFPVKRETVHALPLVRTKHMLKDTHDNLWITHRFGVSVYRPQLQQFNTIDLSPQGEGPTRLDASMKSPVRDEIIAGTVADEGMFFIDSNTGEIVDRIEKYQDGPYAGAPIRCTDIAYWKNDSILFSSHQGIFGLDCGTKKIWNVLDSADPRLFERPYANFSVRNDTIALSSRNETFVLYDINSDELEQIQYMDSYETRGAELGRPVWDEAGRLWLASIHNPGYYDSKTGDYVSLDSLLGYEFSSQGLYINAMGSSGDSLMYMTTTRSGILEYNINEQSIRQMALPGGEVNVEGMHVLESPDGTIWIGTSRGLVSHDPGTKSTKLYTANMGLPDNYLQRPHIEIAPDGTLSYGTSQTLVWFHPDSLKFFNGDQQLVFTSFNGDRDALGGVTPAYQTTLLLPSNHDRFSFRFAAPGASVPDAMEYQYMLEGFDDDWQSTGNRREGSYTKLEGGDYTLRVRAREHLGDWSENEAKLALYVSTPVYKRAWVILTAILVAILLIILILRWRVNSVKKKARVRSEFDRKIAEVEMTALRAQMNPHFLFNCLNSIKYFIIKNQVDEAADYLTKFSRLIRLILNNSKSEMVPLDSEIEALTLYIQMESLRFDHGFEYKVKVDESINAEFLAVPPLLIQPFVENAIWHGLLHKDGPGKLEVNLKCDEHTLYCSIEDDGIGRVKAQELKSKSSTKRKSLGMQITSNRIDTINELYQTQASMTIDDLMSPDGKPTGTRVNLSIPI